MPLPDLTTPEGRRAWALIALVGGCIVFTGFAAVGVYLVRTNAWFAFWLALAAHGQVLVGMTALAFVLGVRRRVKISRDGAELEDEGNPE